MAVDVEKCHRVISEAVNNLTEYFLEGFQKATDVIRKPEVFHKFDIVTEYDQTIEARLIEAIRSEFPDHRVMAEESADQEELTDEPTWVIDPIDGTVNFVRGFPYCCVSVALSVRKEVVLGLVACPPLGEVFSALRGRGAYMNGQKIHVSPTKELKDSLIAQEISMGHALSITDNVVRRFRNTVQHLRGMRSLGCAALTLCKVAEGLIDGYQVEYLKPWDIAAGGLIVSEAGGVVLDTQGGKYDFSTGRVIAAGTENLAKELVRVYNL